MGVQALASRLRVLGHPVGPGEVADALAALAAAAVADRQVVRAVLRCTLVRDPEFLAAFDSLFDEYFPARPQAAAQAIATLREPRTAGRQAAGSAHRGQGPGPAPGGARPAPAARAGGNRRRPHAAAASGIFPDPARRRAAWVEADPA